MSEKPVFASSETSNDVYPSHERLDIPTRVHLIKVEHTAAGGYEAIAEQIRGADILGMEQVGGTREERLKLAQRVTEVLALPLDTPDIIDRLEAATKDPWLRGILTPLIGTSLQVEFIDASKDDPEYEAALAGRERSKELAAAYERPLNPSVHFKMLHVYIKHEAASMIERDELVASQVENLTQRHSGKEVAIVVGRDHSPDLSDAANADDFTETIVVNGHDVREVTLDQEVVGLQRDIDESPTQDMIMRAMLERYYRIAYVRERQLRRTSQALIIEHASRPARSIPSDQLMSRVGEARYAIYGDDDQYQKTFQKLASE